MPNQTKTLQCKVGRERKERKGVEWREEGEGKESGREKERQREQIELEVQANILDKYRCNNSQQNTKILAN